MLVWMFWLRGNSLILLGVEPHIHGHPSCSLVTIMTELPKLEKPV